MPVQPVTFSSVYYEIAAELAKAEANNAPMNSAHEGLAVIHEEYTELQNWVYMKRAKRDIGAMKAEAIQIAAMAIRFIKDVCKDPENINEEYRNSLLIGSKWRHFKGETIYIIKGIGVDEKTRRKQIEYCAFDKPDYVWHRDMDEWLSKADNGEWRFTPVG